MTAPTVPAERFTELLFKPPTTAMRPEVDQLGNMKFDGLHWKRAYNMCIGRGGTHAQCKNIPMDAHISPQNPLPVVFQKETIDAIECMTEHGDAAKCFHYTEFMHKKVNYEAQPPSSFEKLSALGSRAGWMTALIPAALVAKKFIKFA